MNRVAVIQHHFRTGTLVIAGVLTALLSLAVDSRFGPRPLVWFNFKYGAVVIQVPWLIAIFLISVVATFLAARNGTRLSRCLLIGISPPLIIGTLFCLLMALILVIEAARGHRIYPLDFIGHPLVGWLVIPLGAAFLGTLPLLGARRSKQTASK